ncbi:MAG: Tetratricopeptide 2 repeat protein [Caulobacteraceae bacterium]|nr:Tetratricopeptide 2 repeat protein [Caulobacteraceae bacterium]
MSIDVTAGASASAAALTRLKAGLGASAATALLDRACAALGAQDFEQALALASRALEREPESGLAWRVAAIAHENLGRHGAALDAYGCAFERLGQDPAVAGDIGRLALRMGLHDIAEQLLLIYLGGHPGSLDGRINLAHALREQHRYDEAIAILREAIQAHPEDAGLWTSLGVVLVQQGQSETALTFFDEALRLEPGLGRALYYRANAAADLGDHRRAVGDYTAALAGGQLSGTDDERVRFAAALSHLALGELEAGWEAYLARLSPDATHPVQFQVDAEPYAFAPDAAPLEGRSLLLMAEQGLGDEVMFANTTPDVAQALGPAGRLALAVERRLVPLFARSFPAAEVVAHRTEKADGRAVRSAPELGAVELWAPMAAPARRYRRSAADFPDRARFLIADPARVEHWRALLAEKPGRKVGILWKSLKLHGERLRQFAPFDLWRPVLQTPGVSIVNLQYGDCAAELDHAREAFGVEVWQPPGIDLKEDLDDVAALTCALGLTIGFANATINLAGACGAPVWLITPRAAWTQLGTDAYPWYPQVRCFSASTPGGWEPVMDEVAAALKDGGAT